MSHSNSRLIYVAGECPVCPGFMDLYFMACVETGRIFCACPGCGCACDPPAPRHFDSIDPAQSFAPSGFSHATENQLREAGLLESTSRVDTQLEASLFDGIPGYVGRA